MSERTDRNTAEKIVFAIALAVTLAVVGALLVMIFRSGDQPPDVVIETVRKPVRGDGGWRVEVLLRNRGDKTAEAVHVVATLVKQGTTIEESDLEIAFLPHDSLRGVHFVFENDPSCCETRVRATGFESQ